MGDFGYYDGMVMEFEVKGVKVVLIFVGGFDFFGLIE